MVYFRRLLKSNHIHKPVQCIHSHRHRLHSRPFGYTTPYSALIYGFKIHLAIFPDTIVPKPFPPGVVEQQLYCLPSSRSSWALHGNKVKWYYRAYIEGNFGIEPIRRPTSFSLTDRRHPTARACLWIWCVESFRASWPQPWHTTLASSSPRSLG